MLNVGRMCVKTAGREAGSFCIIVDVVDDSFVVVTGPKAVTKVKRRKCNVEHLEPTPEVLKISKNASDDDVISAYKKEGIFDKLQVKAPTEKDIAAAKEAEKKRATMNKEKPKETKAEKTVETADKKSEEKKESKKEEPKEKHKGKEEKKPEPKKDKKPEGKSKKSSSKKEKKK